MNKSGNRRTLFNYITSIYLVFILGVYLLYPGRPSPYNGVKLKIE